MTGVETLWLIILITVGLITGSMLMRVAIAKQRDAAFWFLFGFALPPIAAVTLIFIPHRQKIRHPERIRWYERKWAQWISRFLVSGFFVAVVAGVEAIIDSTSGIDALLTNRSGTMYLPALGLFLTSWAFIAASGLARFVLTVDRPVFAVARVVLDEALHSHVAIGFIAILLIVLAMLAAIFTGDAEQPLRYRVQLFLSWSYITLGIMLGILTILFSCWTLSSEIKLQRIFTVAVKPVNRAAYVFGKWLGVAALNAVLLTVAALAIYSFTLFYLAKLPAADQYDSDALRDEILTARVSVEPIPEIPIPVQAAAMVDQIPDQDVIELGQQVADRQDLIGLTSDQLRMLGRDQAILNKSLEVASGWMTIESGQRKVFQFSGLKPFIGDYLDEYRRWNAQAEAAKAVGRPAPPRPIRYFQLRYEIKTGALLPDGLIELEAKINGRSIQPDPAKESFTFVINTPQVISLPAYFISDDGFIDLEVYSPPSFGNPTIQFSVEDGLSVLYSAGGFTGNFTRAMIAMWVKLSFIAMLGTAAATCLGFPVAAMLTSLITLAAVSSPFLLQSAQTFHINSDTAAAHTLQEVLSFVTFRVAETLQQFARYEPGELLAAGHLFSWAELGACIFWIGFVWIGTTAIFASIVYSRRELAKIQV